MSAAACTGMDAAVTPDLIFADPSQPAPAAGPNAIVCGLHRAGELTACDGFDLLVTEVPRAPAPWVSVDGLDAAVAEIERAVGATPVAAVVLAQVLRQTLKLNFEAALIQESLAYSALLAGSEFKAWRAANPARPRTPDAERVRLTKDAELRITLARPAARNAVDAAMRDALVEALEFALDDPDALPVVLEGEGVAFSTGGDLDEFGMAKDPAVAHLIRVTQSPARLAARLGARLTARLHGACIGSGIEIPAAAARVVAAPQAWFQLPEVSMGLIPGAGGTVTVPRRIGRRRTLFMGLTGRRIDSPRALDWGLIDALEPAP